MFGKLFPAETIIKHLLPALQKQAAEWIPKIPAMVASFPLQGEETSISALLFIRNDRLMAQLCTVREDGSIVKSIVEVDVLEAVQSLTASDLEKLSSGEGNVFISKLLDGSHGS